MNYKITLRRRLENGNLETATYRLEHLHSSGGDEEQAKLLLDMEIQANDGVHGTHNVRVWLDTIEEDQRIDRITRDDIANGKKDGDWG